MSEQGSKLSLTSVVLRQATWAVAESAEGWVLSNGSQEAIVGVDSVCTTGPLVPLALWEDTLNSLHVA